MKLTNDTIWRAVQDQAALFGWGDREALIAKAMNRLCKRYRLTTDGEREELRGRLDMLWIDRADAAGAFHG
ncbi:hypothetical protein SAMN04244548_03069 [Paracoccus pantotrophus]|nr:hypothetical protein SAMN04244548_03069 [Paracoccus pantotrophus]